MCTHIIDMREKSSALHILRLRKKLHFENKKHCHCFCSTHRFFEASKLTPSGAWQLVCHQQKLARGVSDFVYDKQKSTLGVSGFVCPNFKKCINSMVWRCFENTACHVLSMTDKTQHPGVHQVVGNPHMTIISCPSLTPLGAHEARRQASIGMVDHRNMQKTLNFNDD